MSTFSAADNPVIFWTPEHGAFVVRGALNAAWDKLGSSGGVLGAPVGDETYDGEVTAQKFSGGEVSWNRATKEFTTVPAVLAEQLKGLQVAIDPSAAINMAWRAAGGAAGPLGAKKGGQYRSAETVSPRTSSVARSSSARQPVQTPSRVKSWRSTSRWADRSAATWVSPSPTKLMVVLGPPAGSSGSPRPTSR